MESNSSNSTISIMDSNPLYLHHGDSPGSILVTQLLTDDNYYTWSRSMFMALTESMELCLNLILLIQIFLFGLVATIWLCPGSSTLYLRRSQQV
jgi:hypothetical protein